jgi:hypothetical protein
MQDMPTVCFKFSEANQTFLTFSQARVSWGIHGLLKVLLGSLPYLSTSCRRPPLKRHYGRFRAGRSWIPPAIRTCFWLYPPTSTMKHHELGKVDRGKENDVILQRIWVATPFPAYQIGRTWTATHREVIYYTSKSSFQSHWFELIS